MNYDLKWFEETNELMRLHDRIGYNSRQFEDDLIIEEHK